MIKKCIVKRTKQALVTAALGMTVLLLMGCPSSETSAAGAEEEAAQNKGPLLLIVVVDSTTSAQRESEAWREMFPTLLRNYLPDDAYVAFVRCDNQPVATKAIKWTGFKKERDAIEKAFAESWVPRACGTDANGDDTFCGTDIVGAFRAAVMYATKPENKDLRRKLIIAWTDMQPDPCRARGQKRLFGDPTKHRWDKNQTQNIEVVIHGVPLDKQEGIRAGWGKSFRSLGLYMPGEPVDIKNHYRLLQTGGGF